MQMAEPEYEKENQLITHYKTDYHANQMFASIKIALNIRASEFFSGSNMYL